MTDEAKQSHSRSEGSRCPTCGSTIKSVYRRPCDTEDNAADPWHEAESPPAKEAGWPECEEFYNLMQQYRHAPIDNQLEVVAAYEAVKGWLARSRKP